VRQINDPTGTRVSLRSRHASSPIRVTSYMQASQDQMVAVMRRLSRANDGAATRQNARAAGHWAWERQSHDAPVICDQPKMHLFRARDSVLNGGLGE